jgi:hypothetical protein
MIGSKESNLNSRLITDETFFCSNRRNSKIGKQTSTSTTPKSIANGGAPIANG